MKNPHPGGWEAGGLHRSLKAQLSGALCCLYRTHKESYFLGVLVFSLMADMEWHRVLMCLFRACP